MSNENPTLSTKVHPDQKDELERIAYERSSPGDRVYRSQLVREAIEDYIQKWDRDDTE